MVIGIAGDSSGISCSILSRLNQTIPIYYDQSYKRMIVGDYGNSGVLQFTLENTSANRIVLAGGNGVGCNLNRFRCIVCLAMDRLRQVDVVDSACQRVL